MSDNKTDIPDDVIIYYASRKVTWQVGRYKKPTMCEKCKTEPYAFGLCESCYDTEFCNRSDKGVHPEFAGLIDPNMLDIWDDDEIQS